jgi:glycosyltransferase involved in cell wall biosynthesis
VKVNIFTDLRFTATSHVTGVGKHIVQMVKGLSLSPDLDLGALVATDQLSYDGVIPSDNALSYLNASRIPLRWKSSVAAWTLTGRPLADPWCTDCDWVYCPKNDFIPLKKTRLAVTIHGMHELDPDISEGLFSRMNRLRSRTSYRRIVERADLILTVSDFLKRQIVNYFAAAPENVVVVGNGAEEIYFQEGQKGRVREGTNRAPYVLCVGGLNRLDGGDRTLEVARVIARRAPTWRIVVAGSQHEFPWDLEAKALPNVELLGYVCARELAPIMREAVALLYLPRYESFGIAAVEAMAAGTPVVTCRCSSVPEVVGEAGIYVNPTNPEEAADVLLSLESSPTLRERYVASGKTRAKAFSWSHCVARLRVALGSSN